MFDLPRPVCRMAGYSQATNPPLQHCIKEMLQRDFLASFDYFAAARGRAPTESPGDRNARVVQWAWAWPDLAPHVTRLLYDAEHHVRCKPGNGGIPDDPDGSTCEVLHGRTGEWTTTVSSHFSPSLTAFEAAIVFHAVIRPDGSPLVVTFYRGDDTYVVNGVTQAHGPMLPGEKTLSGDFPCDVYRAVRVKRWILRQQVAWTAEHARVDPAVASPRASGNAEPRNNSTCSGMSDTAEGETLSTIVRATSYFCPTCAATFDNADETTIHNRRSRSCRPPRSLASAAIGDRIASQQRDVNAVSFGVQERHLNCDGNPIPGSPIRVCWDGVPMFVMLASEWMWCREEIAAIFHSVPFHRCYRVAELPFVVFDEASPVVPQLSACFDDVWSVTDVIDLVGRGNRRDIRPHLALQQQRLRAARSACVIAGPHIGTSDVYLHISVLMLTKWGTETMRVYVHRTDVTDGTCVFRPNLPCDECGVIVWGTRAIWEQHDTVAAWRGVSGVKARMPLVADRETLGTVSVDDSALALHRGGFERDEASSVRGRPSEADLNNADCHRIRLVDRSVLVREFIDALISTSNPAASSSHEEGEEHGRPASAGTATASNHGDGKESDTTEVSNSDARSSSDTVGDGVNSISGLSTLSIHTTLTSVRGGKQTHSEPNPPAAATCCTGQRVEALRALIYVENIGRHIEQDRFRDDEGLRRALCVSGAGHVCASEVPAVTCACGCLHPIPGKLAVGAMTPRLRPFRCDAEHCRRRPFAPCDSVLVLDYRRHFDVGVFLANAGLQTAVRFGRGKMCRLRQACPSPRSCFFLHFHSGPASVDKRRLRVLRSIYVRNIASRMNACQFVQDYTLQRALSVGEGCVCLGHDGRMFCSLLHFDHGHVLCILKGCRTIEDLEYFAADYSLGRIVTPLRGVNASATWEMLETERKKVERAYQAVYHTNASLHSGRKEPNGVRCWEGRF